MVLLMDPETGQPLPGTQLRSQSFKPKPLAGSPVKVKGAVACQPSLAFVWQPSFLEMMALWIQAYVFIDFRGPKEFLVSLLAQFN